MARTTVKRVEYVNGIPRANLEELLAIFEKDKRLPSVMSRRAWCKARKLDYGFINKWWWRRRSAAVKEGYNLVNEMYELPVGTPPEIVEEEEIIEVESEEEEIRVVEPPAPTTPAPLSRKRRIMSPNPDESFTIPSSPLVRGSDRSSSRTLQNSSPPIQGAYTPAQIARKTVSFAPGTKDLSPPRAKLSDLVLPSFAEMDSCRGRHNPDITCDSCSLRSPSTGAWIYQYFVYSSKRFCRSSNLSCSIVPELSRSGDPCFVCSDTPFSRSYCYIACSSGYRRISAQHYYASFLQPSRPCFS